jgi:hypothetical protein
VSVRSLDLLTERDFRVRVVFGDEDKMKLKEFVETFGDVKVKFKDYREYNFTYEGKSIEDYEITVYVTSRNYGDMYSMIVTDEEISIRELHHDYKIFDWCVLDSNGTPMVQFYEIFDSEWRELSRGKEFLCVDKENKDEM